MYKRLLLILLIAVLASAGLPPQMRQTVSAADPDSHFTFDSATGTIHGYSDLGPRDVVIPAVIGGTAVRAIGDEAFLAKNVMSVVIPDSVEQIGTRAFKENFLTSVTLPASLAKIGTGAFESNHLTSLVIPNHVKEIGTMAFLHNELTSVHIPDGVEIIRDSAFSFNKLTSVSLPDSVKTIENNAFLGNEIVSVTLPAHIEAINSGVFRQNQITSVTIPSSVKTIGQEAFLLNKLTSVALPEGLTSIGKNAFDSNELASVVIPDSVVSMGDAVFRFNRLVSVTLPSELGAISNFAFAENELSTIIIPDSIKTIGDNAFYKNRLTAVALPEQLETIGNYAFSENALTEVNLPESVTAVGNFAFYTNQIASIAFPSAAVNFGSGVFGENKLTDITIPSWMDSIPNNMFLSNQLSSLTLPESVQDIGSSAFRGNLLTTLHLPNSLKTINSRAFMDNQITSLTIPANVTSLALAVFGMNALTSVTFMGGSTSIGGGAFAGNQAHPEDLYIVAPAGSTAHTYASTNGHSFIDSMLFTVDIATGDITSYNDATGPEKVVVPSTLSGIIVTGIGDGVFQDTENATSVSLPDTVTRLAPSSFMNSSITQVRLPNGLTEIGQGTFSGSRLASVMIPGSVTTVGDNAFNHAQLRELVLSEGIETIRTAAFGNNQLEKVLLPYSTKEVQAGAFQHNGLTEVVVLNTDTIIQEDAFSGNSSELVLYGHPGSHAETYAAEQQMTFKPLAELSQSGPYSFADAAPGYAPADPLTVTITKWMPGSLDNLKVNLTGANAGAFEVSPPGAAKLDEANAQTGFTVSPKVGLTAGTYEDEVTITADYGIDLSFQVYFTVTSASPTPLALTAERGDGHVDLSWNSVTDAVYYSLYSNDSFMITLPGDEISYRVQDLENGRSYRFQVMALDASKQIIVQSEQVHATPAAVPGPPTNIKAVPGDGEVLITFTAPVDNGGSAITRFEVTASPGNIIVTGAASPIKVTGLTNGRTYTFTANAINAAGRGAPSTASNAVTPAAPANNDGDDSNTPPQPSLPSTEPADEGVDVLVNGKVERTGTAIAEQRHGQLVTRIVLDEDKLKQRLEAEGERATIAIPAGAKSDVVIGELNGRMVKNMEQKQASVEIKTESASYTLPAQQINIGAISDKLGKSIALQDIKVQIEIAVPAAVTIGNVRNAAEKGTFTIVAPPVDFTVRAIYGDKTIEVSQFNVYVERTIAIPGGVDPNKITTGVVIESDGTARHVPTKIIMIDGIHYAVINSLTNSTYSVVWHPVEFEDVKNHWAKDAVNDMGSRMVIQGTGGGMFDPDRDITRAELVAVLVRGLGLKLEDGATAFSDVRTTDWYNGAIHTAHAYGLIDGFADGTFRPNDKITREQAMSILSKAMALTVLKDKLSDESGEATLQSFDDAASVAAWAQSGAVASVQSGIITGRGQNRLAPEAGMTRAEVATAIQRLLTISDLI